MGVTVVAAAGLAYQIQQSQANKPSGAPKVPDVAPDSGPKPADIAARRQQQNTALLANGRQGTILTGQLGVPGPGNAQGGQSQTLLGL